MHNASETVCRICPAEIVFQIQIALKVDTTLHACNVPFPGTTQVSRYQKGKPNVDIIEARDSEWPWHQLGHMQVCTSPQTDNHASTYHSVFTGRMPFQLPNQQRQNTEGTLKM